VVKNGARVGNCNLSFLVPVVKHDLLSPHICPHILIILLRVPLCTPGTLPETICDAKKINVISLDGLTSSTQCVKYLWDPLHYFNSGYFERSMRGE
jgi:hypothetical protein